jgi:hypothetical protein
MHSPCGLAERDRLVLALRAYFDDSGTHDGSEVVTVAGYISRPEQWVPFAQEWSSAINEWELDFFHMADFAVRASKSKYAAWDDQERRFRFARLVSIVPKRLFDQIYSKKAKRFVGGAYGLAASACFLEAAHILEPDYPSARVAYVFEAGTRGSGEIQKVFNWNFNDHEQRPRLKLISLSFEGKEFTPLQAADILAYELYKYLPHVIGMNVAYGPRTTDLSMLSDC